MNKEYFNVVEGEINSRISCFKFLTEKERIYIVNTVSNKVRQINDPCMDNFRFALKGNPKIEKEYEKQKNQGCCGFFDCEINLKRGITLMFGFNYGH